MTSQFESLPDPIDPELVDAVDAILAPITAQYLADVADLILSTEGGEA